MRSLFFPKLLYLDSKDPVANMLICQNHDIITKTSAFLGVKGLLPTAVMPTTSVIARCFHSEGQPVAHFPYGRSVHLKANETTAAAEEFLPLRAKLEQKLNQARISARELLQQIQGQVRKLEQALTRGMHLDRDKQWNELYRQLTTAKDYSSLDPRSWENKLEQMM